MNIAGLLSACCISLAPIASGIFRPSHFQPWVAVCSSPLHLLAKVGSASAFSATEKSMPAGWSSPGVGASRVFRSALTLGGVCSTVRRR